MGINTIAGFAGKCAVILNKEGRFTVHSFRRSAATALAESGISVVGLCHAGRRKSLVTAQEYHEHSTFEKEDRVDRLDTTDGTKEEGSPAKKKRHGHNGDGVGVEERHTIVHGTYNFVNISGEGGGSFSFMNSGGFSGNGKKE